MRVFCFGFGYVAQHAALALQKQGYDIYGTSRTPQKSLFYFDGKQPMESDGIATLRQASHVLISIPPDESGDVVFRHHAQDMMQAKWIGYLSTTGVYGDWQGEWVDENSPLLATEPRSVRRIEAEEAWLSLDDRTVIFRLAGIYGPGRSAIDQLRAGIARRIDKPGQYFSRIHVQDIANVLQASMQRGAEAGRLFNLADRLPAPGHEVVEEAARLLGIIPPPLVAISEAKLSPMAASFYAANRRVKAMRILRDLGVELCYPTYYEGLKSCLGATHETD